jgi:hypothetical protein
MHDFLKKSAFCTYLLITAKLVPTFKQQVAQILLSLLPNWHDESTNLFFAVDFGTKSQRIHYTFTAIAGEIRWIY